MRLGSPSAIRCRTSRASGVRMSRRKNAHTVAIASGSNARRVTVAGDPGVAAAALMGNDLGAAQVGSPRCSDRSRRAPRTTNDCAKHSRVFLRTGSSFKAAAEELHLHSNSVKYRVHRAIERRGRPINDDRLDIEIALLLCHWYGNAVLITPA